MSFKVSLDCLRLGRDRPQRASECSQVLSPEQPFSHDNHNRITAKSWLDLGLRLPMSSKKESSRQRPPSKSKTPEVLGNVPVRGWERDRSRSDWFGGTVIKQMLGVLCGGQGRVGSSGWLAAAAALPSVLQEEVAYDGQNHHDADPKEHSNHHFKGT